MPVDRNPPAFRTNRDTADAVREIIGLPHDVTWHADDFRLHVGCMPEAATLTLSIFLTGAQAMALMALAAHGPVDTDGPDANLVVAPSLEAYQEHGTEPDMTHPPDARETLQAYSFRMAERAAGTGWDPAPDPEPDTDTYGNDTFGIVEPPQVEARVPPRVRRVPTARRSAVRDNPQA